MNKITFMGAGSTVFVRNVLGDCMCTQSLRDWEFALYDIDPVRLQESFEIISAMNRTKGGHGKVTAYLGVENRKEALRGARFVINAIQVALYDPCTIIDFEVPKKYGLRQTIGDTLGIGGIMRALRTIPVMDDFARDMQEVCPDALFLNYTNPMAMLSGYMQRYTGIETVGLCHSVQVCSEFLLKELGMEDKLEGRRERIAGINHMSWLLELRDKDGNDLYPPPGQAGCGRPPLWGNSGRPRLGGETPLCPGASGLHPPFWLLLHGIQRAQLRIQYVLHQIQVSGAH